MRTQQSVLLPTMLVGIGPLSGYGGGDGTPPPPPPAGYAGTYHCTASGSSEQFDAVLTTASGSFSSCSGTVDVSVAITCTGSISPAGAFEVDKVDANGHTSTNIGTATVDGAGGTLTVPFIAFSAPFSCSRS